MTDQTENMLVKCTERLSYGWIDTRANFGTADAPVFRGDAIPIVFNGIRFEPTAGWSNPWPYGKIRD